MQGTFAISLCVISFSQDSSSCRPSGRDVVLMCDECGCKPRTTGDVKQGPKGGRAGWLGAEAQGQVGRAGMTDEAGEHRCNRVPLRALSIRQPFAPPLLRGPCSAAGGGECRVCRHCSARRSLSAMRESGFIFQTGCRPRIHIRMTMPGRRAKRKKGLVQIRTTGRNEQHFENKMLQGFGSHRS